MAGEIEPLSSAMVLNTMPAVAKLDVGVTVISHCVDGDGPTDDGPSVDTVTPPVAMPKSASATPATAWVKVAVTMKLPCTVTPLPPWTLNVGTGGS